MLLGQVSKYNCTENIYVIFSPQCCPPLCFIYWSTTSSHIQTLTQEICTFHLAFLLLHTVHPAWKLANLAGKWVFLFHELYPLFLLLIIVQTSITSHWDYPQTLSASGFATFPSSLRTVVKVPFRKADITLWSPWLNFQLGSQFNSHFYIYFTGALFDGSCLFLMSLPYLPAYLLTSIHVSTWNP